MNLSSLPRAALATKEGYLWINGIALALSGVIAWMSWTAYGEAGQPDRALVCIVSQGLAIALAILARRALTGQMPVAALAAAVLAAGCAWWASHGLALAWYGDAERNSEVMVIFMAALEPALFLLAEHVKEGRETLRAAHERAEAETAAELAAIRARQDAISNAPNVSALRQTAGAAAALMAFAAPQPAADALPITHHEAPERVRQEAPQVKQKAAPQKAKGGASKMRQEIAAAILQRGAASSPSNREIAAQFKVSPSTVDRLAKSMTPLEGEAA